MLPEVNLLPKYERQNELAYLLFIIGSIIVIILFGLLLFFYFQTKGNLSEAEDHVHQLQAEKEILEIQRVPVETNEIELFETALSFAEAYIVPTSDFINEVITLLPKNGHLDTYSYHYETVEIETQFEQMSDAAAYVHALNNSDFIIDVQVDEINTLYLAADEEEEIDTYKTIPRYEVTYSIHIDQAYLKGEGDINE